MPRSDVELRASRALDALLARIAREARAMTIEESFAADVLAARAGAYPATAR